MLVCDERGNLEYLEKNLSEQGREPTTNSTHIWRRIQELNMGHIGGRQVLSPLCHSCYPIQLKSNALSTIPLCPHFPHKRSCQSCNFRTLATAWCRLQRTSRGEHSDITGREGLELWCSTSQGMLWYTGGTWAKVILDYKLKLHLKLDQKENLVCLLF